MQNRLQKLQNETAKLRDSQASGMYQPKGGIPMNDFYKSMTSQFSVQTSQTNAESLAASLRQRRQHNDQIQQERQIHGIDKTETIKLNNQTNLFNRAPKETDKSGSAFRIRPQTPKINLLKMPKSQYQNSLNPKKVIGKKASLKKLELELDAQIQKLNEQNDRMSSDSGDEGPQSPKADDINANNNGGANGGVVMFSDEQFFDIIDQEEVEDAIDLNEKFLSNALGIDQEDLGTITKIELRVDTSYTNLQVTGEILRSLEYLKLNDSLVASFRDLGTSFKNVRVLHMARCQLKEVHAIEAFEQLEELYLSYNEIEELWDIGFLEHLVSLDLEGNNIKQIDQLYYLRKCTQLNDVNLKYNPVSKEVSYYKMIQDNVPQITFLDDEPVNGASFFEQKLNSVRNQDLRKNLQEEKSDVRNNQVFKRFLSLGLKEDRILKTVDETFRELYKEPDEEMLLVKTIKSLDISEKATYSFDENIKAFDSRPQTPKKNFGSQSHSNGFNRDGQFRRTSLSTFADSVAVTDDFRSVYLARQRANKNNENKMPSDTVSEIVCNTNQAVTGSSLSLLRRRAPNGGGTEQKQLFGGKGLSNDIQSLLEQYQNEATTLNTDISTRMKNIQSNASLNSGASGLRPSSAIKKRILIKQGSQSKEKTISQDRYSIKEITAKNNGSISGSGVKVKPIIRKRTLAGSQTKKIVLKADSIKLNQPLNREQNQQ